MSRTRARAKGRRGGEIEHFAKIPVGILECEAVTTLHHAAFKVLVILASQYRGGNNGALALTEQYARRFGLSGRDTLYRSLHELERRGLIECTRRGLKIKKHFSLYAVGWEAITHREGQPLSTKELPRNRWAEWRVSVPMAGNDRASNGAANTAGIDTDGRECSVPMAGSDRPEYVPMVNGRRPFSVPTIGNTSRSTPGAARQADRIRRFMGLQPHLSDHEVANTFKVDPTWIAQLRTAQ